MVAVALVLAGCAGHGGASDVAVTAPAVTPSSSAVAPSTAMPAAPAGAPTATREPAVAPGHALIATATVDQVDVFAGPGGGADRTHHLAHPNQVGAPRTFLVEQMRDDWLQVLLPPKLRQQSDAHVGAAPGSHGATGAGARCRPRGRSRPSLAVQAEVGAKVLVEADPGRVIG